MNVCRWLTPELSRERVSIYARDPSLRNTRCTAPTSQPRRRSSAAAYVSEQVRDADRMLARAGIRPALTAALSTANPAGMNSAAEELRRIRNPCRDDPTQQRRESVRSPLRLARY